jgi:hypothetical protein
VVRGRLVSFGEGGRLRDYGTWLMEDRRGYVPVYLAGSGGIDLGQVDRQAVRLGWVVVAS